MSIPEAGPAPKGKISVLLKVLFIGLLMLILLIPTLMTAFLVQERKSRQGEASREVMASWATEQVVGGPVLVVPYEVDEYSAHDVNGYSIKQTKTYYAYFLPETLKVEGDVKVEERARGIFKVPVYTTQVQMSGGFNKPDFSSLDIIPKKIHWEKSFLRLGLSDLKGIRESLQVDWDGKILAFQPGSKAGVFLKESVELPLNLASLQPTQHSFQASFKLAGAESLSFLPLGKESEVKLTSNWPHPQFMGEFLPESRQVGEKGFEAKWKVVEMARGFPQVFSDQDSCSHNSERKYFGARFVKPIDIYSLSDRSLKYAMLFIFFTFISFFLFEILGKLRIHPIQYLLVGLALCVFYVLLLSLSEHFSFAWAYAAATFGTVGLISFYVSVVLKKKTRVLLMSALLSGLYAFLYVLLQLEDFALLIGALGLFTMLASVMFLTRKINWYEVNES